MRFIQHLLMCLTSFLLLSFLTKYFRMTMHQRLVKITALPWKKSHPCKCQVSAHSSSVFYIIDVPPTMMTDCEADLWCCNLSHTCRTYAVNKMMDSTSGALPLESTFWSLCIIQLLRWRTEKKERSWLGGFEEEVENTETERILSVCLCERQMRKGVSKIWSELY